MGVTWQDAVFVACDLAFFADLILYAQKPDQPHPPWRSRLNAALLMVCAATGWTLALHAWALLTVASAATWALIAHRNAAKKAAKIAATTPTERAGAGGIA